MDLALIGLSHRTAAVSLREQFAIPPRELASGLHALRGGDGVREALILSTCNRTELYVVSCADSHQLRHHLVDVLAARSRLDPSAFVASLYQRNGREAVQHLFRVAAGLDSMVLGESEITAQVKQAYAVAQAEGAAGPILNRLFQKALHATKLLRSQTRIAEGRASIGSVVAQLARQTFGAPLAHRQILLWGAGKAAEATMKHLVASGIGDVWVVNRTPQRAEDLATICDGRWLSWEQARKHLVHVDIAIVCTQAPHYVIDQADLESVLPSRAGRPLVLIDLAVPRNIDPAVGQLPTARLYNIDDLQAIAQEHLGARQEELTRCEALLDQQVHHFLRWHHTHLHKEAEPCALISA